jgi:hypothetical protein
MTEAEAMVFVVDDDAPLPELVRMADRLGIPTPK